MASCSPGKQKMKTFKELNTMIQTQFIGRNPFKKPPQVDISTLRVTNDKPKKRTSYSFRYEAIFKELDIGKSIACQPDDCDKIAQALRAYIVRNEKPWRVKSQMRYTKNTGRIFVLEKT